MSDTIVVTDEQDGEFLPAVRTEVSPTLFNTSDPSAVIEKATAAAEPLAHVVRKQGLAVNIQGREHVKVEGWTLLGSMLGVFPVCTWTRKLEDGWEARVEARTIAGALVGAAEAECLRSESSWKNRDDYALRSMAQTRATSKALRQPLGFVMQLAGFEATPAEEMPHDQPAADPHGLQSSRADAPAASGDASDKQKAMIARLAKKLGVDAGPVDGLSKRDASAKIGQLVALEKTGAVGEAASPDLEPEIPF